MGHKNKSKDHIFGKGSAEHEDEGIGGCGREIREGVGETGIRAHHTQARDGQVTKTISYTPVKGNA